MKCVCHSQKVPLVEGWGGSPLQSPLGIQLYGDSAPSARGFQGPPRSHHPEHVRGSLAWATLWSGAHHRCHSVGRDGATQLCGEGHRIFLTLTRGAVHSCGALASTDNCPRSCRLPWCHLLPWSGNHQNRGQTTSAGLGPALSRLSINRCRGNECSDE